MDFLTTLASRVMEKAMDGTSMRHKALASNIANAETPNYRPLKVQFESNLKSAIENERKYGNKPILPPGSLKTTSDKHYNPHPIAMSINDAKSDVSQAQFNYRQDNNGVDIEMEMAALARNTGKYAALSRMENQQFQMIKSVIKGGGLA